ncbi:MAG TPA: helix-turn-helix transcriptional regulator [Eubacteriales bacterium]|nr:helix-turn-helix transcriptional regulator [Eubacteriales bacterium]
MAVEQELKALILRDYRSVRAFSEKVDLPYSTIDSIFKRGIANSSVANILKICKELGIDADALGEGRIEKRHPTIIAAAAHFNPGKLTDEGRAMYEQYIEYLADRFSKEKEE